MLENSLSREIHASLVKNFMKILILSQLDKAPMGGYDFIKFFYNKYNLLFSSGTIYSCLYSMERNGMVKGIQNKDKRIYKLTDKGRKALNTFRHGKEDLLKLVSDILR